MIQSTHIHGHFLSSMPNLATSKHLDAISGTPPNMIYPPKGDAFAPRNPYALEIDFEEEPPFFEVSKTHYAATWLLHPDAPKVELPKAVITLKERRGKIKKMTANTKKTKLPQQEDFTKVDYTQKVLEVKNLKKHFFLGSGSGRIVVPAVDDVTFDVYKREVFWFSR